MESEGANMPDLKDFLALCNQYLPK
jgi:hypothetical protein